MKKILVIVLLFLVIFNVPQLIRAESVELETAVSKLWLEGPDQQIEQTLNKYVTSSDEAMARKAMFHLSCMQMLKGNEKNAAEMLCKLEESAKDQSEKDFVEQLRKILKIEKDDLPESMQNKINIDLKSVRLSDALKMIALQAELNIAVHQKINGIVEVKLADVTAKQALVSLCKSHELDYRFLDGLITVFPKGLIQDPAGNYSGPMPEGFQTKISLDFKDTDVRTILKILAAQSGANIVIHKNVNCRADIALKDATVEQALNSLCATTDLRYENNDGIFLVMPANTKRQIYSSKEVKLFFLSPDAAVKMLLSAWGKSADLVVKPLNDSVVLEGYDADIERMESFLKSQDKKGNPKKISFKIWKLDANQNISMEAFSAKDEATRKKMAKIIAAPSVITLPGKEAKIEVNSEKNQDSFSYSLVCIFHETERPDILRLIANVKVKGVSLIAGEKSVVKKEFAPTLEIKRNDWVMIVLNEGSERLFLELQISNYLQ